MRSGTEVGDHDVPLRSGVFRRRHGADRGVAVHGIRPGRDTAGTGDQTTASNPRSRSAISSVLSCSTSATKAVAPLSSTSPMWSGVAHPGGHLDQLPAGAGQSPRDLPVAADDTGPTMLDTLGALPIRYAAPALNEAPPRSTGALRRALLPLSRQGAPDALLGDDLPVLQDSTATAS